MIHETYRKEAHLRKIRTVYVETGMVRLDEFLEKNVFTSICERLVKSAVKRVTTPLRESFDVIESQDAHKLLMSSEIREVIARVANLKSITLTPRVVVLSWKDYMLIDADSSRDRVEAILDLTPNWNDSWGGLAYYSDGKGTADRISHAPNSLAIVNRDGRKRYVSYVNHHANDKKHYVIILTF